MSASDKMRFVSLKSGLLHVETPNGIVNIRVGLEDRHGRPVDSIETIPDRFIGERKVTRRGPANVRLVRLKKTNRGES